MSQPLLSVTGLRKSYGGFEAVRGISFDIAPGEVFALIGPNGAGKSTALRMLATLLRPSGGDARLEGHSLAGDPEAFRRRISYLPEEAGAYKNMRGLDYLCFMAALFSHDKAEQERFVARGEALAGLDGRLKDKVSTYSKGMTRKLLLARTLMPQPRLAILDEPTSGLDISNGLAVRKTVRQFADQGMTVLLSSHNMLEIEYLSDRVAIIAGGTIHEAGKPDELKKRYKARNLEEVFFAVMEDAVQRPRPKESKVEGPKPKV